MAWRRAHHTSEEELQRSLSDLVTVCVKDAGGETCILGTAFPVAASDTQALMLTARHVIEEGYDRSSRGRVRPRIRHRGLPGEDNLPHLRVADWAEASGDLTCLIVDRGESRECTVAGINTRPPLDIALLTVDIEPLKDPLPVFVVNSDPLALGEQVVLPLFVTDGQSRELHVRVGEVIDHRGGSPLVEAPMVTTNIPVEPGASGGPVFRFAGSFEGKKEVVGVVTSDMSEAAAFTDPTVNGHSYVSLMWSAAPLGVKSPEGEEKTFKDLCLDGLVVDLGIGLRSVSLTFKDDGNWCQQLVHRRQPERPDM